MVSMDIKNQSSNNSHYVKLILTENKLAKFINEHKKEILSYDIEWEYHGLKLLELCLSCSEASTVDGIAMNNRMLKIDMRISLIVAFKVTLLY